MEEVLELNETKTKRERRTNLQSGSTLFDVWNLLSFNIVKSMLHNSSLLFHSPVFLLLSHHTTALRVKEQSLRLKGEMKPKWEQLGSIWLMLTVVCSRTQFSTEKS